MVVARITSYNVLSDYLCQPSHFVSSKPEDLDSALRFTRLTNKLQSEIAKKSVICLQEVTMHWESLLHPFFSKNNYHFITALYGRFFNGYMGVAIAFPIDTYELLSLDICRLVDTKQWDFPYTFLGFKELMTSWIKRKYSFYFPNFTPKKIYAPPTGNGFSVWKKTRNRENRMITVKLKSRTTGEVFHVATYHMPCSYREPQILIVHVVLAIAHLQKLAGSDPYVLAGDFNCTPDTSVYDYITTGYFDQNDPSYPSIPLYDNWKPIFPLGPVRSAYAVFQQKEPNFTNYSKVEFSHEFFGTLDYIFISDHWFVQDVLPLPQTREDVGGPLPWGNEPSDHLLIAADLFYCPDAN